MSTNAVHAGRRLRVLFSVAHLAGDLVYESGYYGVVQDNVAAAAYGTLILEGVWTLPRIPSTSVMGAVLAAPATAIATSLLLGVRGATVGMNATTGWNPIGRLIATSNATVGKVQLFNPNPVY
jgi:predicted RecA/RadA family phage recombinase